MGNQPSSQTSDSPVTTQRSRTNIPQTASGGSTATRTPTTSSTSQTQTPQGSSTPESMQTPINIDPELPMYYEFVADNLNMHWFKAMQKENGIFQNKTHDEEFFYGLASFMGFNDILNAFPDDKKIAHKIFKGYAMIKEEMDKDKFLGSLEMGQFLLNILQHANEELAIEHAIQANFGGQFFDNHTVFIRIMIMIIDIQLRDPSNTRTLSQYGKGLFRVIEKMPNK